MIGLLSLFLHYSAAAFPLSIFANGLLGRFQYRPFNRLFSFRRRSRFSQRRQTFFPGELSDFANLAPRAQSKKNNGFHGAALAEPP